MFIGIIYTLNLFSLKSKKIQYKANLRLKTELKLITTCFFGIIIKYEKTVSDKGAFPMDRTIIEIKDTYITLGQFLKLADVISSGGMAKPFLQQMEVFVNDELENRRGKKLYDKDVVSITNIGDFEIKSLAESGN